MNTQQTLYPPTHPLPPAQLWIGMHDDLDAQAVEYLQKILCKNNGCASCATCHNIRMQQHFAITWLHPEKQYTLDDLSVINTTLVFALEDGEHHFFVLHDAHALTPTCSNSLLKSIEEPPTGYHFILLTDRPQELLPTIRSRCIEHVWKTGKHDQLHHSLFAFFTAPVPQSPNAFLKELEQSKISERESVELLDQLLLHWISVSKKALLEKNRALYSKAQHRINMLKRIILTPPMPGSSALLWKDLFLACT